MKQELIALAAALKRKAEDEPEGPSKKPRTYQPKDGVPRPANCYILFRQAYHKQVKEKFPNMPNKEICEYLQNPL